jgi:hypothetical protein
MGSETTGEKKILPVAWAQSIILNPLHIRTMGGAGRSRVATIGQSMRKLFTVSSVLFIANWRIIFPSQSKIADISRSANRYRKGGRHGMQGVSDILEVRPYLKDR